MIFDVVHLEENKEIVVENEGLMNIFILNIGGSCLYSEKDIVLDDRDGYSCAEEKYSFKAVKNICTLFILKVYN